jgi:hypothetical protein
MVCDLSPPLCPVQRDGRRCWVKQQVALTAARAQRVHWLVLHDEQRISAVAALRPLSKGALQLLMLPAPGL